MSGSLTAIIATVVVAVVGVAFLILAVVRASRHPQQEHPQPDATRGLVQGGHHVGGGRSVAPTRDAPVPEGGGTPPAPEEQEAAYGHRPPVEDRQHPLDPE